MAKNGRYDRRQEDIGNVVALEHVNVCIPDQRLATLFYISGLGLTRDPYLVTSVTNMWVNAGRTQFHLPTRDPLVVRGVVGLVMPDRKGLLKRLATVKPALKGTKFSFRAEKGSVTATCPWGNRFRIHTPSKRFGRTALGIVYVEFDVPKGNAAGIARFYREIVGAPSRVTGTGGTAARIQVGDNQELIFRETGKKIPAFDGHHIQIYIADFSGPYEKLLERGLISEESNQHQYRFEDIVDPDTGKVLFTLDHEMRSLTHPLFARPLINRNPDQTNAAFGAGHEARSWALPYSG
ncbi:MAG: hypothetical protein ACPGRZ_15685 [Alphaproteobacteria bacterium]